MLLRVIFMICFGILRIFGEKSKKNKNWKSGHIGLLRHNVGNPRRGLHLHQGMGCLAMARLRCQNGTPRVRHGECLRHSVATVHRGQNFGFLFRKFSFCTPIV